MTKFIVFIFAILHAVASTFLNVWYIQSLWEWHVIPNVSAVSAPLPWALVFCAIIASAVLAPRAIKDVDADTDDALLQEFADRFGASTSRHVAIGIFVFIAWLLA